LFKNDLGFIFNRLATSIHYPHFSDFSEKQKQEVPNKLYFYQKYKTDEGKLLLNSSTVRLNADLIMVNDVYEKKLKISE
jgi:hypothetical protein